MEQKYLDKIRNINEVKISYDDTFYDFQQKFNTTQNFLQVYNTIDEKLSDNTISIIQGESDIVTMNNINNITIDSTKVAYEVSGYQKYNDGKNYSYINYFTAGDTNIQIVKQQIIRTNKTYVFTLYSKLNSGIKYFYVGFSDGNFYGKFLVGNSLSTPVYLYYDLECYVKNSIPYFNIIRRTSPNNTSSNSLQIVFFKIKYPENIGQGDILLLPDYTSYDVKYHSLNGSYNKLISYFHDKQSNKITYFNQWLVSSVEHYGVSTYDETQASQFKEIYDDEEPLSFSSTTFNYIYVYNNNLYFYSNWHGRLKLNIVNDIYNQTLDTSTTIKVNERYAVELDYNSTIVYESKIIDDILYTILLSDNKLYILKFDFGVGQYDVIPIFDSEYNSYESNSMNFKTALNGGFYPTINTFSIFKNNLTGDINCVVCRNYTDASNIKYTTNNIIPLNYKSYDSYCLITNITSNKQYQIKSGKHYLNVCENTLVDTFLEDVSQDRDENFYSPYTSYCDINNLNFKLYNIPINTEDGIVIIPKNITTSTTSSVELRPLSQFNNSNDIFFTDRFKNHGIFYFKFNKITPTTYNLETIGFSESLINNENNLI